MNKEEAEWKKNTEEPSSTITTLLLFVSFLIYVTFGALLLPLLNGEVDFINGLYYNFLCLTAIDFGQLIPQKIAFLPITFTYVCVGLALTTIAIDDGSKYVKKLHHLGEKIKNVAATKIWFGGKTLKVREVLYAVGKKCGISASVIDEIDLDDIIEEVIAQNEGKLPISVTNEEELATPIETAEEQPSPYQIDPCFAAEDTVSLMAPSEVQHLDTQFNEEMVATQVIEYDETTQMINFAQAEVMAVVHEEISEPSTYMAVIETIDFMDDEASSSQTKLAEQVEAKVLRKFKEKKEFYARDPHKLLQTYEEEWKRIESLTSNRRRNQLRGRQSNIQMPSNQSRSRKSPASQRILRETTLPDS
uniref:Potassium channel domain-containing protein n=1 Tax=Setaria digitata TaxID=48799 RepID=A0A915PC45_9BILA